MSIISTSGQDQEESRAQFILANIKTRKNLNKLRFFEISAYIFKSRYQNLGQYGKFKTKNCIKALIQVILFKKVYLEKKKID